jgi:calcium-dependent protein kinase
MVPEKDKDLMFRDMDTDGNGTIEYSEFVAATMKFDKEKRRDHLRKAFDSFDLNGDGFIDRDEILGALKLSRGDVDMQVFEKTY